MAKAINYNFRKANLLLQICVTDYVRPHGVFHRVRSDAELGSASVNLATRYEGIDMKTNFSIYDIDMEAKTHRVVRLGEMDQF